MKMRMGPTGWYAVKSANEPSGYAFYRDNRLAHLRAISEGDATVEYKTEAEYRQITDNRN